MLSTIGQMPSILSFVCAALTVIIPLVFNAVTRSLKEHGEPPWKRKRRG
ncbi:hypothetical protein [Paenibacillus sp. 1011MAR3C5]|nr:hypothetical protein [Paenibacillus sp. 1011MAR3C5]